jgi:hypothetical protein
VVRRALHAALQGKLKLLRFLRRDATVAAMKEEGEYLVQCDKGVVLDSALHYLYYYSCFASCDATPPSLL